MHHVVDDFKIADQAMRYSLFVPRLYNYCLSLGFDRARMMPSRAFCSDESQGYPIILLMQHFGTFPFDHGRVGGRVATDRHGPHSHHGEDFVIIQASHVGYDPKSKRFGVYQRRRRAGQGFGDTCGKLCAILHPYRAHYAHACDNILLGIVDGAPAIFLDNQLLRDDREDGVILHLDRLIAGSRDTPLKVLSTAKAFRASPDVVSRVPAETWQAGRTPIGRALSADLFAFRSSGKIDPGGEDLIEAALLDVMPDLVTSPHPALDAARYTTQVEFDRTYRSLPASTAYHGKNMLFIAGLNIDVSPPDTMPFPLTKFVPWAAYVQRRDGNGHLCEQDELVEVLTKQSTENAHMMSMETAIQAMVDAETIEIQL